MRPVERGDPRESIDVRIARCVGRLDLQRRTLARQVDRLRRPAGRVDTVRQQARRVGRSAATWVALILPLASLVFRRRRWMRTAMRVWGAVRLARGVAAMVVQARRWRAPAKERTWA